MANEISLEHYRAVIREGGHYSPLSKLIGYRLVDVEPGRAVIELETGAQHQNPMGTVHGGIFAILADSAMGVAHGSLCGQGQRNATIELKVNYLRPMSSGLLRAIGTAVRHGRTITYLECEIQDAEGNVVVRASSTGMTLKPEG